MIDLDKIYRSIPIYINELYLDKNTRKALANEMFEKLKDTCDHDWKKADVKLINASMCSKCSKLGPYDIQNT